jgi:membrane-associated protease RseP (regulator of RpoE activity)
MLALDPRSRATIAATSMLRSALYFYVAVLLIQVVFLGSSWIVGVRAGARVRTVSLGMPTVKSFERGGTKIMLGLFPVFAYVAFAGLNPLDEDSGPGDWRRLPLTRRFVILLAPWVATFVMAVLCLGPVRAARSGAHTVAQFFVVLDTTPLVRGFLHLLGTDPLVVVFGVLAAKMTVFNLLPLPSLAGGRAVGELVAAITRAPGATKDPPHPRWALFSMLFVFVWCFGRFAWGLWHALVSVG